MASDRVENSASEALYVNLQGMGGKQLSLRRQTEAEPLYLRRRSKWGFVILALTAILFSTTLFALNIGFAPIPLSHIAQIIVGKIPLISRFVDIYFPQVEEVIIIEVRLPRILAAVLVGAALATAGSVFQGIFRNPMADPYVIGVSSGAALGGALAIVLKLDIALFGFTAVPTLAFASALITVFLVYNIAKVGSKIPVTTLLLSGIAVSIFLSAIVSTLKLLAGQELHALVFWLMGGFSHVKWEEIASVWLLIVFGVSAVYLFARDLNLMSLGEEEAQHLGVDVEKSKKILLALGCLMTAAAVSIGGLIGFVGLIVPHLTRILVGPDHRVLIPTALLTGSIFLVLCDTSARIIFLPAELPVGIITALSGGPFFIYLLRRRRGGYWL